MLPRQIFAKFFWACKVTVLRWRWKLLHCGEFELAKLVVDLGRISFLPLPILVYQVFRPALYTFLSLTFQRVPQIEGVP
jgi:hypothetical protein